LLFRSKPRRWSKKAETYHTTDSETPDKAKIKRVAMRLQKVGTIEIKVYREWYGKKGGAAPGTGKGFFKADKVIPEKALKGDSKSHAVEYVLPP
jgi:hypothetical protein